MMLRRLLDWILGRHEPVLDFNEKERRLAILSARLETRRRGR